jgi:hypothetical protein
VSARESAHSDQANQAAVRRLIPPIPRLCFLAPSVTTLHYSTTVSQALRQTLRGKGPKDIRLYQLTTRTWWSWGYGGGTQVISPASVFMVNIPLTPSENHENAF